MTIRHLLNHTSGNQNDTSIYEITRAPDVVQLALAGEPTSDPGTEFGYNNKATNLLADIVLKLTGKPVNDYLNDKLFTPLQITDFWWNQDSKGNRFGMSGLPIHHTDLLKVGQMLLVRGKWQDKQIVNPNWLDESLVAGPKFNQNCGLLWWIRSDAADQLIGFSAQGYMGQYLVIIPESRIVGVRQSDLNDYPELDDPKQFDFIDFTELLLQLSLKISI